VTLALSGGAVGATLGGTVTVNAVNGVAAFTDLTIDKSGTGYTLTASSPTLTSATIRGINVTPAPATHLVVTGASPETAGGLETVTVTAVDVYGNTDTSYAGSVKITSSDVTADLPAPTTLTDGVGTFNVTLKTSGSETITATDTVTPAITGTESGITVTPGTATQLVVTGASTETAGKPVIETVTAEDAYGNTATGYTGTVQFTSTDPEAELPLNYTFTDGVVTFGVVLKTAGVQSVTATDTVTPGITGTEGTTVTAGTATQLVVTGASTETAGGVETVTVTAEDAYGNTDTSYAGSVKIT